VASVVTDSLGIRSPGCTRRWCHAPVLPRRVASRTASRSVAHFGSRRALPQTKRLSLNPSRQHETTGQRVARGAADESIQGDGCLPLLVRDSAPNPFPLCGTCRSCSLPHTHQSAVRGLRTLSPTAGSVADTLKLLHGPARIADATIGQPATHSGRSDAARCRRRANRDQRFAPCLHSLIMTANLDAFTELS
jgi:hypothetical protein